MGGLKIKTPRHLPGSTAPYSGNYPPFYYVPIVRELKMSIPIALSDLCLQEFGNISAFCKNSEDIHNLFPCLQDYIG